MAKNLFLSIVQAVTEVLKKSHFSLQIGNCTIPVAEESGHDHVTTSFPDVMGNRVKKRQDFGRLVLERRH